ncbi:hypothetical protein BDF19DRAFT_499562 [Syncephalis fuscata]|nr:hypothetical protein BDF19DRAFT_499562 [Syncephalis fuscata]
MSPPQNVNTAYLYPMDAYETVELFSTSLKEMRKQLTLHIIMSYVQGHNINIALRLVIEKPRALARWCCLMPSVLCIGISILTIMFDFAKVFYMDTLALYAGFTVPISIMCYSIILLQKAYTMSQKSRWVLVIGIMLIILQIITPVIMLNVDVMANFELYRRGFSHYPKELILLWFCTSLAVNLFLSSVFSYTAYKQYLVPELFLHFPILLTAQSAQ